MRLAGAFFGMAILSGVGAACLAQWVPATWLPQVGLLAVAGFTFRRGGSQSVLAAWAIGWCFDALSAAPPGSHAFLFVLAWMATRFASFQVQLRSPGAFSLYVFALSLGLTLLSALTLGRPEPSVALVVPALIHAAVNALFAAPYRWCLWKVLDRFEDGEPLRAGLGGAVTP